MRILQIHFLCSNFMPFSFKLIIFKNLQKSAKQTLLFDSELVHKKLSLRTVLSLLSYINCSVCVCVRVCVCACVCVRVRVRARA